MLPYVVKVDRRKKNFDTYIGRAWAGLPDSKWSNPFHAWMHSRTGCIKLYENYIRENADLMAAIHELEGKALGCWCYPEACHGDVLVRIYKELSKPGIGDMAQAVNMHGDLCRPEPGEITELFSTSDGVEYVRFSDQAGFWPRKDTVWP